MSEWRRSPTEETPCPSTARSRPPPRGSRSSPPTPTGTPPTRELLRTIYAQLVWIRAFEQYVLDLAGAGLIHGPAHSSIGQEGGAVGSVLALTSEDSVNGSHRGHHQFLAKALHHVEPKGMDPLAPPSDEVRDVLLRTLAEICGLDRGWSHGRGGSMHLQWKEAGAMGTNAIVGGGVPQAAGFAFAHQRSGTDAVVGHLLRRRRRQHRLHPRDDEPRRRLVAAGLLLHREQPVRRLHLGRRGDRRAAALRPRRWASTSPRWKVDGMDPLAVHLAMTEAVEHMRRGRGADRRRGRHLPLLPPERRLRRQRLRLPRQGRGEGVARARPAERPPRPTCERLGLMTPTETDRAVAQARKAVMEEIGDELLEPVPDGKPGQRRIKRAGVARPRRGSTSAYAATSASSTTPRWSAAERLRGARAGDEASSTSSPP